MSDDKTWLIITEHTSLKDRVTMIRKRHYFATEASATEFAERNTPTTDATMRPVIDREYTPRGYTCSQSFTIDRRGSNAGRRDVYAALFALNTLADRW